jgi:hypothetical protein
MPSQKSRSSASQAKGGTTKRGVHGTARRGAQGEEKPWRPWSDHPVVVTAVLVAALVAVVGGGGIYEWVRRLSRHDISDGTATAEPARTQTATDGKKRLTLPTPSGRQAPDLAEAGPPSPTVVRPSGSLHADSPTEIQAKDHEARSAVLASQVTFQDLGGYLYEEVHTSAQVDDILQRLANKSVTWEGWIANVSPESDGGLSVLLRSRKEAARAMAFLSFPSTYRSELLSLNRDQRIRATCTFVDFSGLAFNLKACQLLQVME